MTRKTYTQSLVRQRKEVSSDIKHLQHLLTLCEQDETIEEFYDARISLKINARVIPTVMSRELIAAMLLSLETDLYNCDVCLYGVDTANKMHPSYAKSLE